MGEGWTPMLAPVAEEWGVEARDIVRDGGGTAREREDEVGESRTEVWGRGGVGGSSVGRLRFSKMWCLSAMACWVRVV